MGLWWRLVRLGFRLLYNQFAFTYDWISRIVSLGAWRCWTRTAINYVGDRSPVLELAHGTGNLQLDLYAAGYRPIGYDLSPAMGKIAQGKLRQQGFSARLVRGRAQQLPFASETFAAVISTFPTDFITAPETLREVYRILKPDGVFVIVPNALLTGGGRVERTLEWLYRITGQRGGAPHRDALGAIFVPFTVEIIEERCPRSVVTVIIARKNG
jgi:ubiquinone/menaquinone biosynthesis C-methylase UbiE